MTMTAQQLGDLATASADVRRRALTSMDKDQLRDLLLAQRVAKAVAPAVRRWQWFGWLQPHQMQNWLAPAAAAAMLVVAVTISSLRPNPAEVAPLGEPMADSLFESSLESDTIHSHSFDTGNDQIGFASGFEGAG